MDFFSLVRAIYDRIPNISADEIKDIQRDFAKRNKMKDLPSKSQILHSYFNAVKEWKIEKNQTFETLLRKRAIRSLSWIVPVQVLTKPWPCPWQCIFCPNDPWMPKSYIKSEPWAMRAWLNQFDPLKQVYNRLQSLTTTGHQTDKIEMIVLWWSWDAYPRDYKIDFIKQLYDACNTFSDLKINQNFLWNGDDKSRYHFEIENLSEIKYCETLTEAIKLNETAKNRIIWLTIETRPDLVSHENCIFWREIWVTRVEMWIQSTDDEILKLNKRGHDVEKIKDAIYIMRQYWFKISIHLMPWLYGSNYEKDIKSFVDIYSDPYFQPDEIKFYPTSVIPNTVLYNLYKEWKYSPITTEQILKEIRETFLNIIPPYTRIKRLIRDIPANEIVAWSNVTNLSQMAHESLLKEMRDSYNWNWSIDVEKFYRRLYWDYKLYSDIDEYFSDLSLLWEGSIDLSSIGLDEILEKFLKEWMLRDTFFTQIIWKDPDLESFRNFVCLDTRSREVRNRVEKKESNFLNLVLRWYKSSVGLECFMSFEDELWYLYWFTRLLLPYSDIVINIEWLGEWTAIIRELHVYWELQKIWEKTDRWTQHTWLWRKLLSFAEKLSKSIGYKQLSVISGVWVREYYWNLWFKLVWTYMLKNI